MINTILSMIAEGIGAVGYWLMQIFSSVGAVDYFIGVMFIWFGYKYLLAPVLGHAGSDEADEKNGKKKR